MASSHKPTGCPRSGLPPPSEGRPPRDVRDLDTDDLHPRLGCRPFFSSGSGSDGDGDSDSSSSTVMPRSSVDTDDDDYYYYDDDDGDYYYTAISGHARPGIFDLPPAAAAAQPWSKWPRPSPASPPPFSSSDDYSSDVPRVTRLRLTVDPHSRRLAIYHRMSPNSDLSDAGADAESGVFYHAHPAPSSNPDTSSSSADEETPLLSGSRRATEGGGFWSTTIGRAVLALVGSLVGWVAATAVVSRLLGPIPVPGGWQ